MATTTEDFERASNRLLTITVTGVILGGIGMGLVGGLADLPTGVAMLIFLSYAIGCLPGAIALYLLTQRRSKTSDPLNSSGTNAV
ncbi:hypothetical protein ACIGEP_15960 [Microbacterium sp. NPDC077663]|uniref:hypothetical protein n=1 Tax=Microbacterium sp. NPDC077663 TaxID=3364189 RepID=UPI0037CA3DB8